jgi:hypothetical protein
VTGIEFTNAAEARWERHLRAALKRLGMLVAET